MKADCQTTATALDPVDSKLGHEPGITERKAMSLKYPDWTRL